MDKKQIIQMARDAGADCVIPPMPGFDAEYVMTESGIERFAAAIRAATKEEDAKICDTLVSDFAMKNPKGKAPDWFDCSEAIRASK